MNKTKRILIICAIVLNFLYAALNIFFIVRYFMAAGFEGATLFFLIYDFFGVAGFLINSGLLWYAIAHKGQLFRQRNNFYMAAVIISVLIDLFSVATILLIITLFLSDWVWVKPQDDEYFSGKDVNAPNQEQKSMSEAEKTKKIAKLRELKESGKISEAEFKDELMKLL